MAKEPEPAEDLPAPKEAAVETPSTGGKMSIIISIVTILAIPLLMILTWEVYMMPSLKKLAKAQPAPTVATAGAADATASADAAPAKEPEVKTDAPKAREGDAAAAEGTYELKDVVANLSGAMRSRYIKVSFTLEGKDKNFPELMKTNDAKIRDATLAVLSDLTIQDLEEPGVKNILRNNILTSINQALRSSAVEQLYFSEFVVQ
jgi:flagellar protein FliL